MKYTEAPWPEEMAPIIKKGDTRIMIGTYSPTPPQVDCRLISEGNFQHAKKCVNGYEALETQNKDLMKYIVKPSNSGGEMKTPNLIIESTNEGGICYDLFHEDKKTDSSYYLGEVQSKELAHHIVALESQNEELKDLFEKMSGYIPQDI